MKLTNQVIKAGVGCDDETADRWKESLQIAVDKFLDGSPEQVASFLVVMGQESHELTVLRNESDVYSADRLAKEFPTRFAIDPGQAQKMPNEAAHVAMMGDIDEFVPDYFQDRGPIRISKKSDYEAFLGAAGVTEEDRVRPEALESPGLGAMSAAWAFSQNADERMEALQDTKSEKLRQRYLKTLEAMETAAKLEERRLERESQDPNPVTDPAAELSKESQAEMDQLRKTEEDTAAMTEGYNKAQNMLGNPATGDNLAPETPANEAEAAKKHADGTADHTGDVADPPAPGGAYEEPPTTGGKDTVTVQIEGTPVEGEEAPPAPAPKKKR